MPKTTKPTGSSRTIASSVYDQIRGDILSGELKPGERLRVDVLRERYSSSASPVREALNRLSAAALVTNQDNRGFCVPPVSRDELLELYKTREWLESRALAESIANGDAEWGEALVLAQHRLERTQRCLDDGDQTPNPEWELLHRAFHIALISACGSGWLMRFCEQLHDQADRYRQLAVAVAGKRRDPAKEHAAIVKASLDRDAEEAVKLLNAHYNNTRDIILKAKPSVLELEENHDA